MDESFSYVNSKLLNLRSGEASSPGAGVEHVYRKNVYEDVNKAWTDREHRCEQDLVSR